MTLLCRILIILSVILPSGAIADDALPKVRERLVLLLPAENLKVHAQRRDVSVHIAPVGRAFPVHRTFLQDRIASQGVDTGDYSGSEQRIRSVLALVGKPAPKAKVLLELLLLENQADFTVGYFSPFDADRDYARYFPERARADTIELEIGEAPPNASAWEKSLVERTAAAVARLKQHRP